MAGGGIEGVLRGLEDGAPPAGLVTVCHDLTEITRQALIDGRVDLVISHPLEWMADLLVEAMAASLCSRDNRGVVQQILPFQTYTVANV